MANERAVIRQQNSLRPAQFCAIKLAKTPKLFKVNVHENIHWLNQQELMVAEIGLEREEPKARRILMLSFRLKLKLPVYNTTFENP